MKYSPEQLTLPYDTPSESAVRIRSIDWRVTGLSEHTWRQVRELLIVVAYCSRRDGYCCARRETLLQLVNDHSDAQVEPLSLRTLERRHLDAVQLGLLQIERRYKRSAVRLVNQQRVNELLAASRKLAEQQRESACAKSSGGLVADQWRIKWRLFNLINLYQPPATLCSLIHLVDWRRPKLRQPERRRPEQQSRRSTRRPPAGPCGSGGSCGARISTGSGW